jgi:hypothetical protein
MAALMEATRGAHMTSQLLLKAALRIEVLEARVDAAGYRRGVEAAATWYDDHMALLSPAVARRALLPPEPPTGEKT